MSLSSGTFPTDLKRALVKPLLKKPSLDPNVLKNYRPISNLAFLSKVIEKVVAQRLFAHMTENNLHEKFQSAYKPCHSTETALLRVQNDILRALDKRSGVFLVLLDLSAAFDTVDHEILLTFLETSLGIHDTALRWFKSYLLDRSQCISIDGVCSDLVKLLFGVPQGAVMGANKFCTYILPIGAIIRHYGINFHIYADDTQLYITFNFENLNPSLIKLQSCISDIRTWMITNKLKINDTKTEFLIIASPHLCKKLKYPDLLIGDCKIKPCESARNLGVMFDKHLTMDKQIQSICRSAHFHLRNISSIRNLLTDTAVSQLVHALVTSRLDYCNSLLTGITDSQLNRLQRFQNNAARVVCRIPKFDHITPTLKALHWLPVKSRIIFKILLLTYRILNGLAPDYLSELLTRYEPKRSLRSSGQGLLTVPTANLKSYGDRAFSIRAPKEWNHLPVDIRNATSLDIFKKQLKTYLFTHKQ